MATASRVLELGAVRDAAAAVLAPVADDDPAVIAEVVDALTPPALMLVWGDPWLELGLGAPTMGPCLWTAHLQVLAIAARIEPGPGIATLETLAAYVVERMHDDDYPWPLASVSGPRQFLIVGVDYLGARITYDVPVTV